MFNLDKDRAVIAALIAGSIALVVYAEIALRNDPHHLAASFDRAAQALVAETKAGVPLAGPSYQAQALAQLAPSSKNGPIFRLDDLSDGARRESASRWVGIPKEATHVFAAEFDDPAANVLRAARGASTLEVKNGVLRVVNDGPDHLETAQPLAIPGDAIREIAIRMRADRGNRLAISWQVEGSDAAPGSSGVEIDLFADGRFHTYVIDVDSAVAATVPAGRRISNLYLIPSNEVGATVEIDFIRFRSYLDRYAGAPAGVSVESVGGVQRRSLYMIPSQQLVYAITVPESAPELRFGMAVLADERPVTFEVLAAADGSQRLFERTIDGSDRWEDARIDLSPFAGREIDLALRVRGGAQNVAFWSNPRVTSAPRERMNILVILEDAVRADRLSTQGYWRGTTPNRTDLVESGGVVFTNAFAQATKTRASIASLMTSLPPTATGVWNLSHRLGDPYLTAAEILRSQGYRTAAFIQNGNAGVYAGLGQGFDEIFDHDSLGRGSERILGEPLRAWLGSHADENFFLYLHVLDPHAPYDPPAPFDHGYRKLPPIGTAIERDPLRDPPWLERPTAETRERLYEGEIRHNDSLLPDVIRTLDDLALREHTLIVLTSDHGEYLGERGFWGHRPPGQLPAIRVPLMLANPARFSGLTEVSETVALLDLLPTLLDFAGVDRSGLLLQGDSLLDLIEGRDERRFRDRIVVSEEPVTYRGEPAPSGSFFYRDWHMIWSRTFKVRQLASRGGAEETGPRIFEFRDDPDEIAPQDSLPQAISTRYWATVRDLQETNSAIRARFADGDDDPIHRVDPDEARMLRDLGYVR